MLSLLQICLLWFSSNIYLFDIIHSLFNHVFTPFRDVLFLCSVLTRSSCEEGKAPEFDGVQGHSGGTRLSGNTPVPRGVVRIRLYICLFPLTHIRRIRKCLSASWLVHIFITSRLDYCNFSSGRSAESLKSLRHVQNASNKDFIFLLFSLLCIGF